MTTGGPSGNNLIYMPAWVRISTLLGFLFFIILGLWLIADAVIWQIVIDSPAVPLSFLSLVVPAFFAFLVAAFGRRYMPENQIAKRVERFFTVELPNEFRINFPYQMEGIGKAVDYKEYNLRPQKRGAEYCLSDGERQTWINIWYDLVDMQVLFRICKSPDVEAEAFREELESALDDWRQRFDEKSWRWRCKTVPNRADPERQMVEIWFTKPMQQSWIYDTYLQTVTKQEIGQIALTFMQEMKRWGCDWCVQPFWLQSKGQADPDAADLPS